MRIAKGHGTGNDFVILPDPDGEIDLTPQRVVALCDRRRGIGGDGVLRVVRTARCPEVADQAGDAEWFMDYRNADGSVAQMCGNGSRVYTRYLLDSGLADLEQLDGGGSGVRIATRAGRVTARVEPDADLITVAMPRPVVGAAGTARLGAREFPGTQVTVGNPNLVCRAGDQWDLEALDLRDPPGLDPALFPAYANIEFVTTVPAGDPGRLSGVDLHVRVRVYERGVGETLSCGSGACAVAAVAVRDAGLAGGLVAVDVPGGRLLVTLRGAEVSAAPRPGVAASTVVPEWDLCLLSGPAVIVATGEVLALPGW